MVDIVGPDLRDVPYYGMMEATIGGAPVVISQTGFSGEKGYEVYVRDASLNAEAVWYAIRGQGAPYGLRVIAPGHHRRIAAGILSWGQDMDAETSPFQVNLGYQVPKSKIANYIGKEALERQRDEIEEGGFPFKLKLAGLKLGGLPVTDYASDFWLVQDETGQRVGYVTSVWWSPELAVNIALALVPHDLSDVGTPLNVELPESYSENPGEAVHAEVCDVPFRPSQHPSARELAFAAGQDSSE